MIRVGDAVQFKDRDMVKPLGSDRWIHPTVRRRVKDVRVVTIKVMGKKKKSRQLFVGRGFGQGGWISEKRVKKV